MEYTFAFEEKKKMLRQGKKEYGFFKGEIEPKNPHSLVCFILQRGELQRLGALLPAVLQVIINSLGWCCSVPAELMFLNTPLPLRHVHKLSKNNSGVVAHVT